MNQTHVSSHTRTQQRCGERKASIDKCGKHFAKNSSWWHAQRNGWEATPWAQFKEEGGPRSSSSHRNYYDTHSSKKYTECLEGSQAMPCMTVWPTMWHSGTAQPLRVDYTKTMHQQTRWKQPSLAMMPQLGPRHRSHDLAHDHHETNHKNAPRSTFSHSSIHQPQHRHSTSVMGPKTTMSCPDVPTQASVACFSPTG